MSAASPPRHRGSRASRGSAMVVVAIVIAVLAGLGLALSLTTHSASEESNSATDEVRAQYAADAAVAEALAVLLDGGRTALTAMTYPRTLRGTSYSVHVTLGDADPALGDDLIRLVGTADVADSTGAVEVLVRGTTLGTVAAGAFGDDGLVMDNTPLIDSYDSSLGTYASQATNTHGSDTYAGSNGNSGSNQDVDLSNTAKIFGDATPGPVGTVTTDGSSYVSGSTAPAASSVSLSAVTVPSLVSTGDYTLSGTSATLTPGSYRYDAFLIENSAVLTIEGPAVVVVDDANLKNGSQLIADTTGGPVEIYVQNTWMLQSGSAVGPADSNPAGLAVRVSTNGGTQTFENPSQFTGTFYAPLTSVVVENSAEIWGSVVAKHLTVRNSGKVHIDESLSGAGSGGPVTYARVSWRPLSPVQVEAITGP